MTAPEQPIRPARRLLILCTGNSARSQIAEALLARKAGSRFIVASAGSRPASRVHPLAVQVLHEAGIEWSGRSPKSIDAVAGQPWDMVITVCDRAREACPVLPGKPILAHWGMPDPAEVEEGPEQLAAFRDTLMVLAKRIDLLLALPDQGLDRLTMEQRVRAIGATPTSEGSLP